MHKYADSKLSTMRSAALVLGLLLLAGCAGKTAAPKQTVSTDASTETLPSGVTNILRGHVTGADLAPLAGAMVELASLKRNVTTAANGTYEFTNLEPHDYLISVSREAYKTKTQRAIVEDGKIYELDFQLEDKPRLEPYKTTTPFRGLIACEGAFATDPENVGYQSCGTVLPGNVNTHEFSVEPNAVQVLVEVVWKSTTPASAKLAVEVASVGFGHQDTVFGKQHGPSGMKVRISQSLTTKYYPQGGTIRVALSAAPSVTPDGSAADAGIAIQQDFTIYMTVFYVEPGPANFSAIPS
jgi:hypothetical protein